MHARSVAGTAKQEKTGLLLWLLLQVASVTAATIPTQAKAKRANETLTATILSSILSSFASSVPTASKNGTNLLNELLNPIENGTYSIHQNSRNDIARAANLDTVRGSFLYGDPVAGGPSYPSGELGVAKNAQDMINLAIETSSELGLASTDGTKAEKDIDKYGGLKTLEDYTQIYKDEWLGVLPQGPDPGVETNYTQDLFFSMQRLSTSPFSVRRLGGCECLPFSVDDHTARAISGMTLRQLLEEGRLFYSDHRDQAQLNSTDRYAAACDAYFYIDAKSGDFLPLAIRTNTGANLIYTPLDSPNDWLLAKMMYNVNDFWFAQWNHLAATHEVVQIVWMAAIRSLSREHPIYGILHRVTFEAFSIQVTAESILFKAGGTVDLIFPHTGQAAQDFATDRYKNQGAGRFQANYLRADLKSRGLIDHFLGPTLKHLPYYEDAGVIHDAIHTFMTSFVKSYYESDSVVAADAEVQTWVAECHGDAECIDFPSEITTISTLVDVLTHIAHLGSSAHHAVNTNELLQVSSTLPFSPPSLYAALPTEKSVDTNPVDFLPSFDKILEQLIMASIFARPLLAGTNRTIIHMFNDPTTLSLMNSETREANTVFMQTMKDFSARVSARDFDADGLSQGMPFVWKALDPNVAPYSVTV